MTPEEVIIAPNVPIVPGVPVPHGTDQRILTCLLCGTRGNPISNTLFPGREMLAYVCPACGHEWPHPTPTNTKAVSDS